MVTEQELHTALCSARKRLSAVEKFCHESDIAYWQGRMTASEWMEVHETLSSMQTLVWVLNWAVGESEITHATQET